MLHCSFTGIHWSNRNLWSFCFLYFLIFLAYIKICIYIFASVKLNYSNIHYIEETSETNFQCFNILKSVIYLLIFHLNEFFFYNMLKVRWCKFKDNKAIYSCSIKLYNIYISRYYSILVNCKLYYLIYNKPFWDNLVYLYCM